MTAFPEDDDDEFGDRVQPQPGFAYPGIGDRITALADYQTHAHNGERTVRAGDVGIVTGIRKPGSFKEERGYIGLCVHFERVSKSYPAGFVVRWDKASDPALFSIRPPSQEELKQEADAEQLRLEAARRAIEARENEYGDKSQPLEGFQYPESGDKIIAVSDYETCGTKGERFVRAGDTGVITGIRMPGTFAQEHGYIGLCVHFDRVAGNYPAGFVIRWDKATDPAIFFIPSSEEKAVIEEARNGTRAPVAVSKPLALTKKPAA